MAIYGYARVSMREQSNGHIGLKHWKSLVSCQNFERLVSCQNFERSADKRLPKKLSGADSGSTLLKKILSYWLRFYFLY